MVQNHRLCWTIISGLQIATFHKWILGRCRQWLIPFDGKVSELKNLITFHKVVERLSTWEWFWIYKPGKQLPAWWPVNTAIVKWHKQIWNFKLKQIKFLSKWFCVEAEFRSLEIECLKEFSFQKFSFRKFSTEYLWADRPQTVAKLVNCNVHLEKSFQIELGRRFTR